ncbi:PAS domain S-box protein [Methylocucumis oryzae]|nr:PAS domain S-box protein [Methylocucumis oryzae]
MNEEACIYQITEHLTAMIESSAEAVITINQNGIIEEWNSAATKTFGWSKTEAVGLRLSELIIPHRYRSAHEAGMQRFLTTGATQVLNRTIELTALNNRGIEFPVELSVWPVKIDGTYWFSAFIRDI